MYTYINIHTYIYIYIIYIYIERERYITYIYIYYDIICIFKEVLRRTRVGDLSRTANIYVRDSKGLPYVCMCMYV